MLIIDLWLIWLSTSMSTSIFISWGFKLRSRKVLKEQLYKNNYEIRLKVADL